ncbi:MAG: DUF3466 family protein [Armatimonadetes bacterium]|nr:DUF3466 family protein [Armatimonadota bacterium]
MKTLLLTRHRAAFALFAVSLAILVATPQSHQPQQYIVTDLGTLGGTVSFANGINERGQVIGWSLTSNNDAVRGFVAQGDEMRLVRSLGGEVAQANGINDGGQVVGISQLPHIDQFHAFVWDGSKLTDIGTLGGDNAGGRAINNRGVIVGSSQTANNKSTHAFRYENGTMEGFSPSGDFATATAINDCNQIVGYFFWRERKEICSFLWQGDTHCVLPSIGGRATFALGLNGRGKIVGVGDTMAKDTEHAFIYDNASGKISDLGTLGGDYSEARSINDAGQVVGFSTLYGYKVAHGFIVEDGKMIDLNTRLRDADGYEVESAYGINDVGQIAATGFVGGDDVYHALRLDPMRGSALTPGAVSLLILAASGAFVALAENFRKRRRG